MKNAGPLILWLLAFSASVGGLRAQVIVGFNATRGGSYNLQSQGGVRNAINLALPSATFSYTSALDSGALTGATGVVIMSPIDNINPISALTPSEQAALMGFVQGGGFAIIATDAGYTAAFNTTNASFLAQFGLTVTGTDNTPITMLNPTGNPITNGPFGLVTSLKGIAGGPYTSVPGHYQPLGQFTPGTDAVGYFASGALGAGSGAILFLGDSNSIHSGWATMPDDYDIISNFVAYAMVPEPGTYVLLGMGLTLLAFKRFRRR